ncbi:MAG: SpoIIE family protein phosphatase [Janthinobacterium lividum]
MRFFFRSENKQQQAPSARSLVRTALLALASVSLSEVVRFSLNSFFGTKITFITFFPALVYSAWIGGWAGGLFALTLSTLITAYFFINSSHAFLIANSTDQVTLIIFIGVGLSISAISSAQHTAQREAEESAAEARRNESALRESEARKASVLEAALDCIITTDTDGLITEFNPSAQKTFGYRLAEVVGRPLTDTIIPVSPYPHRAGFGYDLASGFGPILGQRIEANGMRKDGWEFPVEIAVVSMEQGGILGYTAYLRDISERKALELEQKRLAEREHRIAEQLQQALQPPVPYRVPGLELADYYKSALEEAGVGGDFTDVFASDKGVTFLVVGDLSGKGLAAASQVAIVRNMLRFALYNGRTLAGPVTTLSHTLVNNDLLTGFATLFVGRYEAASRILSYVNCGQDAGLILRCQTGKVETLPPTGPVLGAFDGAEYTEETQILEPGDVLAVFTDGLTEAGPARTALLTGEGVASILAKHPHPESAQAMVAHIIAGVDSYAQNGVRDDQCLLVGIAD